MLINGIITINNLCIRRLFDTNYFEWMSHVLMEVAMHRDSYKNHPCKITDEFMKKERTLFDATQEGFFEVDVTECHLIDLRRMNQPQ